MLSLSARGLRIDTAIPYAFTTSVTLTSIKVREASRPHTLGMPRICWRPRVNEFTHDAVVADIGETHMRFAVVHTDRLTIEDYVQFGRNVFASVVEALAAYRRSLPICPPALGIAIANSESLLVSDLERRLAEGYAGEWHHVKIIESIDALSLILPDLAPHDVVRLGWAEARRDATKAVASVGDALGVGILAQINGSCTQFHTHAGSMSFAPRTHGELDILERVRGEGETIGLVVANTRFADQKRRRHTARSSKGPQSTDGLTPPFSGPAGNAA
ncbi:hypothetical protein N181_12680 [Sinorhizobium fredii USDA 205]|uniref:Uncharacterized protein n=2 Tax=Rhizobium fredii TaxID=380 RepID=I3XG21_SINF2|nr:hypothetical protein USDA257_p01100 [Sinorhizobium fredii USDA 257]KSV90114.1 hypothetical protein N181_12680 [Sinorhizobium fredii USDA 205]MQX08033.1 hypothetical protein [Sinorhizobium fredii]